MASFHAVEEVMNVIITREGDTMYKNLPDDPVDYIEHFRYIRTEHIEQWSGMLRSNMWYGIPSLQIIDDAIAKCRQNKIIPTEDVFTKADKSAMSNRIGKCVKFRIEKVLGRTVEYR